jgi:TolB-like protein
LPEPAKVARAKPQADVVFHVRRIAPAVPKSHYSPHGRDAENTFTSVQEIMRGKARWIRISLGAAIAIVALAVWHPWHRDPLAPFANIRFVDSVAVLPVENRTGRPELQHVCAGITDEIVGRLRRVGLIKVSDPYSVQSLLALGLSARQLADSLGVERLVLGSLYQTIDGVRLNMRVSNGRSGDVISSDRYEWNSDYGFEAALSLAQSFVDDYLGRIFVEVPNQTTPPAHGPGHESYLIGRAWLGRRTPEGMARARAAFSEALALDSANAEAYAGLSSVYALSLAYRYQTGVDGYAAAGLALAAADRAIELDPNLASGYSARGYLASRSFAPVSRVASDCRKAIDLEPSAADVLSWCARVLNRSGAIETAFRVSEQAIALDPQNAGRRLALAYDALALGRYDRAAREAHLAGQLEADLMLPRAIEARAQLLAGRAERCAAMELGPHAGIQATCLYELGRRTEAAAIVDSLESVLKSGRLNDPVYTEVIRAEDLATYYAWGGDPVRSLAWVKRAYELSPSGVEPRVLESALFDRVREDPVFASSVEEIRAGIWDRVQLEAERSHIGPRGE